MQIKVFLKNKDQVVINNVSTVIEDRCDPNVIRIGVRDEEIDSHRYWLKQYIESFTVHQDSSSSHITMKFKEDIDYTMTFDTNIC